MTIVLYRWSTGPIWCAWSGQYRAHKPRLYWPCQEAALRHPNHSRRKWNKASSTSSNFCSILKRSHSSGGSKSWCPFWLRYKILIQYPADLASGILMKPIHQNWTRFRTSFRLVRVLMPSSANKLSWIDSQPPSRASPRSSRAARST